MTDEATFEQEEISDIPDSWALVQVKQLFDINYGKGLTKAERDDSGNVPVFGSNGITGWHIEALTAGATIIIGRKGSAGEVHLSKVPCWVIDTAYFVDDSPFLSIGYIYYALKSAELVSLDKSTAIPSLRRDDIYTANIPLAPINEQKRIVDEIEAQFTRLDAGIAALKRLEANLKRYKASVLKAACEGDLVPQAPDDEPASELLARILQERREKWEAEQLTRYEAQGKNPPKGWQDKYQAPVEPDTDDLPELPEGWVWATVEQLGTIGEQAVLTGPFGSNLGKSDFTDSGVPVLTIGCLQEEGITLDKAMHVSEQKATELDRYRLQAGDLLFSRMASVGRAGFVTEQIAGAIINYHIMRLRLEKNTLNPDYFIGYVRGAQAVVKYLIDVNHGATRDGINTSQLLALPVALPPIHEQQRIVHAFDSFITLAQSIESVIEHTLKRSERLRQSILKEAFTGRLVPQDASDEPASELLKRIQAEREK